jgi:hypothetical protein
LLMICAVGCGVALTLHRSWLLLSKLHQTRFPSCMRFVFIA